MGFYGKKNMAVRSCLQELVLRVLGGSVNKGTVMTTLRAAGGQP